MHSVAASPARDRAPGDIPGPGPSPPVVGPIFREEIEELAHVVFDTFMAEF